VTARTLLRDLGHNFFKRDRQPVIAWPRSRSSNQVGRRVKLQLDVVQETVFQAAVRDIRTLFAHAIDEIESHSPEILTG
jgi:hypothetical protein